MIGTGSSGTNAVRFGTMKENVLRYYNSVQIGQNNMFLKLESGNCGWQSCKNGPTSTKVQRWLWYFSSFFSNELNTGNRFVAFVYWVRRYSRHHHWDHCEVWTRSTTSSLINFRILHRLRNIPETIGVAICAFDKITDAAEVVIEGLQKGVTIGKVELLDEVMIKGT